MRQTTRIAFAIVAVLFCDPAVANDSEAELKTGGLVFTKSPDVEMRSEELFISTQSVDVRYRFYNRGSADVSTLVAFPMPDLRDDGSGENIAIPEANDNFLGFATAVDGIPVPSTLKQKATVAGVDYTALLRVLHVPLMPFSEATVEALDRVPADRRQELLKTGLVESDDSRGPDRPRLSPRWALESAYVWRQVFPAGREVIVEHHYKPSVGGAVATLLSTVGADKTETITRYCVEPSLITTIAKAAKLPDSMPFSEQWISYILRTGANWAAPIADFRLVVDKGSPRNLVSFCGDGIRKISPTQFEMRKCNFLPYADLEILILVPPGT